MNTSTPISKHGLDSRYTILTECEGVSLFKGLDNTFKVVYGARVNDFCTIEEAMDLFKACVLNALECSDKLN